MFPRYVLSDIWFSTSMSTFPDPSMSELCTIYDGVIKWKHFPRYWVCGEFTGHRLSPCTKDSDVERWFYFDLHLSKQLWGWWFETPWRSLWRHSNDGRILSCRLERRKLLTVVVGGNRWKLSLDIIFPMVMIALTNCCLVGKIYNKRNPRCVQLTNACFGICPAVKDYLKCSLMNFILTRAFHEYQNAILTRASISIVFVDLLWKWF